MAELKIGTFTNAGTATFKSYLGSPAGNLQDYNPADPTTITELQGITTLNNSGKLNLREDLVVGTLNLDGGEVDLYGTDRFLSCTGDATVANNAKITHSHTDDAQRPFGYITANNYTTLESLAGVITSSNLQIAGHGGNNVVYGEFGAYVSDDAVTANGLTGGIIWSQNGAGKHVIIEAYIPSGQDGITRQASDIWDVDSITAVSDTKGSDSLNKYSQLGTEQVKVYYRIFDGIKFHYGEALYTSSTGTWYITTDADYLNTEEEVSGSLRWVLAHAGAGATIIYDVRRNTGAGEFAMDGTIELKEALVTALKFQFGDAEGLYIDADGHKITDSHLIINDSTEDLTAPFKLNGANITAFQSVEFENLIVDNPSTIAVDGADTKFILADKLTNNATGVDGAVGFALNDYYSTSENTDITNTGAMEITNAAARSLGAITNSGFITFAETGSLTATDFNNSKTAVISGGAVTFSNVSNNGSDAENFATLELTATADTNITGELNNGEFGSIIIGRATDTTTITALTNNATGTITTAHADVSHENADQISGVVPETTQE